MSELKGQLLGILLVVIIFGTLAVSLKGMFTSTTTAINNQISEVIAAN